MRGSGQSGLPGGDVIHESEVENIVHDAGEAVEPEMRVDDFGDGPTLEFGHGLELARSALVRRLGSLEYLDVFPASSATSTTEATASGRGSACARGCTCADCPTSALAAGPEPQAQCTGRKRRNQALTWACYMQTSPFAKLRADLLSRPQPKPANDAQ